MSKTVTLSVVIPSYNESLALKKSAIDSIAEYLKNQTYSYEVLIVDDGSTNNTVDEVEAYIKSKKGFRVLRNEHGGKAITVMTGMLDAKGGVAVFTDMDQATPLDEVEKFFPKFDEGFDIVIGSRQGRKGAPLIRKTAAWGFALLRNIILGLPFSDTQCGFKAFNKKSRDEIFSQMKSNWGNSRIKGAAVNAGFDVETLYLAKKRGYRIAEVEVNWHHVGTEQVQIVRDSVDAIKDMLRIKLNDLMGKYDH